jgi:hypothetical protein
VDVLILESGQGGQQRHPLPIVRQLGQLRAEIGDQRRPPVESGGQASELAARLLAGEIFLEGGLQDQERLLGVVQLLLEDQPRRDERVGARRGRRGRLRAFNQQRDELVPALLPGILLDEGVTAAVVSRVVPAAVGQVGSAGCSPACAAFRSGTHEAWFVVWQHDLDPRGGWG